MVVASIALLLSSRAIWIVSVCLGIVCGCRLGFTVLHTRTATASAEQKIRAAAENVQKWEN